MLISFRLALGAGARAQQKCECDDPCHENLLFYCSLKMRPREQFENTPAFSEHFRPTV